MANNSKDVELRIRARDYSQKTLKQVTDAISEMSKAQDAQRLSAEKGETSNKDLENSYRKLEDAGKALLKLNALVEVFKRQDSAMTAATAKAELARAKQQELNAEYAKAETVTKKQETALARASRAADAAAKSQATASERLAKTTSELGRFGIASDQISSAQSKIVAEVGRVNAVLAKQEEIIAKSGPAAVQYKQAQIDKANADKASAEATRLSQAAMEDAAHAQNKVIDGLRRQADQAIATSRGYKTLGAVVSVFRTDSEGLANQLKAIVNPGEAARQTLGGIENQVKTLDTEVRKAGKDITDINSKVRTLGQAQQAAVGLARLVDQFRQQVGAIQAARNEYRTARTDVQNLANQMRSATGDVGNLGVRLQEAQQRAASAAQNLRNLSNAARQSQAALKSAGVDTRNLSDAEVRLIGTSTQATAVINTLSTAVERNSNKTRDGAKAFSFFAESGRQSLSMLQRVRGEVLALATTYVGLQGGITLAGAAIDAFKMRQQAMVKISTVVGNSQSAINAEWDYMVGLANTLGIDIGSLSASYSKFAVSAKAVGISLQETKFIFENIAKAGRVFHLSADDMDGIFRAMEQMLSKGQVYAEELRGQLGERLPGAVAQFAKGMGMTVGELTKQMEAGAVSSQDVINFAREQGKAVDAQLAASSKGVDAMEARARNAMKMFALAMADSGFITSYTAMLEKLTEYLASDKGTEGAKKLGEAFSMAADSIIWCIDNLDLLVNGLMVFAGLKTVGIVIGLVQSLSGLGKMLLKVGEIGAAILTFLTTWAARLTTATGLTRIFGIALGALARAIPFVGWALLALDLGAIMYKYSTTFSKAVDEIIRDFMNLGNQILAAALTIPAAVWDIISAIIRPVTTLFADSLTQLGRWIASVVKLIPGVGDSLANFVNSVTDDITRDNKAMFSSVSQVWDDVEKKWVTMNNNLVAKYADSTSKIKAMANQLAADMNAVTQGGGFAFTADPGTGATQRDRDIAAMRKEFDKLTESAKKAEMAGKKALQRKNLSGRLALVDEEFAPQRAKAKGVGGAEGDALMKQLDAVIAKRKQAETDEYNASNRSASGINKRKNAIEALGQAYAKLNESVNVAAVKQDPNATLAERTTAALEKMHVQYAKLQRDAEKIGGTEGATFKQKLTDLEAINAKYLTEKMQLEEVVRLQDKVNSLLATRKARLDEINAKREAGVISEDQQVAQTTGLYAQTNPEITAATNALQTQAQGTSSLLGPEETAKIMANIAQVKAGLEDLTGTYTKMDTTIVQGVLDGMAAGMKSVADSMVGVINGTMTLGDAFSALGTTVLQFFADFLMQIAQAILKQMLLNALASTPYGAVASAAVSMGGAVAGGASKKHNGGIIGSATSGGQQRASAMNPGWFTNAPRFHSGGLPGLRSDEVPTILQKGEQVLSKDDPENILNKVGQGASAAPAQSSNRFVLVDDRNKISEAMNTPEGENAMLIWMTKNAPSLKAIVKG